MQWHKKMFWGKNICKYIFFEGPGTKRSESNFDTGGMQLGVGFELCECITEYHRQVLLRETESLPNWSSGIESCEYCCRDGIESCEYCCRDVSKGEEKKRRRVILCGECEQILSCLLAELERETDVERRHYLYRVCAELKHYKEKKGELLSLLREYDLLCNHLEFLPQKLLMCKVHLVALPDWI